MDAFNWYAYSTLGMWTIRMSCQTTDEQGQSTHELIYASDHPAIDDEDPVFRAVQLLSQVLRDLEWAVAEGRPNHIEAS